jgi:hypothetical protein
MRSSDRGFSRFAKGRWASVSGDEAESPLARTLLLGLLMGVPVGVFMCWLIGGWVPAVVVALIGFCAIQGLWRGAAEIVGLVVGLVLAMVLAAWLGRMFERPIGSVTGTKGLMGRLVSTIVCGGFVALLAWGAGSIAAMRVLRERPDWRGWNKLAGGGLGAFEGVLLALIVLWVPSAVRPIAAMRASADREAAYAEGLDAQQAEARVLPLAKRVLEFADDVEQSAVGRAAAVANPVGQLDVLDLAEDFIVLTRDPAARDELAKTPAWQEFMNLASMQQARAMVEKDPALKGILAREGITIGGMRAMLESDTTLRILDETSLARDLDAIKDRLKQAIEEVAQAARVRRERGPG